MNTKLAFKIAVITLLLSWPTWAAPVSAQESEYEIRLRRDFGYGAGANVRGTFTISLSGDESQVASVEFLINGQVMAAVEQAPFRFQFQTDEYGFGQHQLSARVVLRDGRVETTPVRRLNFIRPEEERENVTIIFVGIGGVLLLSLLVYGLIQLLFTKRKPRTAQQGDEARSYGVFGGAICSKCGQPYPRHWWGVNLGFAKLDRCEHCGAWGIAKRASAQALRAAEQADVQTQLTDFVDMSFDSEVKDALEDTKYIDEI
jgi:hypothetical protein